MVKTKKLGRFSTPQEASDVYQQALNNIKLKRRLYRYEVEYTLPTTSR
jgi:hypothetical protein